ncbi:MAG TPA: hypothetical protein PKA20_09785 [Burkholderiaceae bacterium]|nr:hypothetical protein [Burkholderiaceae bacterium]
MKFDTDTNRPLDVVARGGRRPLAELHPGGDHHAGVHLAVDADRCAVGQVGGAAFDEDRAAGIDRHAGDPQVGGGCEVGDLAADDRLRGARQRGIGRPQAARDEPVAGRQRVREHRDPLSVGQRAGVEQRRLPEVHQHRADPHRLRLQVQHGDAARQLDPHRLAGQRALYP